MPTNAHAVSISEIKYAIENRDGRRLANMYADDAVLRVVDRDNPPSKPREIRGKAANIEAMRKLIPTHVLFNGKVGALTGKNALTAKVGETVLIVHSEANRDSRPHLIGGHGDYVWETGKFSNPQRYSDYDALRFAAAKALGSFCSPTLLACVTLD